MRERSQSVIRIRDTEGRLYTDTIGPNDNAEHLARRLLKEKRGHNSFYAPIKYPTTSYH
jgi:hypothetical protein